jgi:serine/threonine protein kinase
VKLSDRTVAHLRDIAEQPDLSGTRYTIVRELGRGGMAVVYEAEDRELGRSVALKVLALEISSPAMAEQMRVEAQTIARLEHPGIVPVHDVGMLPDGRAWYAMKLVRGETMKKKGTLRDFLRICETVAFAHAHGVVHGDLKPDNVMLGAFGEVLVMDWAGATLGTRGYMAPEQERAGQIDARADVYALGRILQNVLAGQRVTRPLAAIVRKAVDADRERRYADAAALAADVRRYIDGEPVSVYRAGPLEKLGRWVSRNRVLLTLIAAYIAMRVLIFLLVRR